MTEQMNEQEIAMLRDEIELLMRERTRLLCVVGAAAVMVANTNGRDLPAEAAEAAEMLSKCVNALSEETLRDALETVRATVAPDQS